MQQNQGSAGLRGILTELRQVFVELITPETGPQDGAVGTVEGSGEGSAPRPTADGPPTRSGLDLLPGAQPSDPATPSAPARDGSASKDPAPEIVLPGFAASPADGPAGGHPAKGAQALGGSGGSGPQRPASGRRALHTARPGPPVVAARAAPAAALVPSAPPAPPAAGVAAAPTPTPHRAGSTPPVPTTSRRPPQAPNRRRWVVLGGLGAVPVLAVLGVVALLPRAPATPVVSVPRPPAGPSGNRRAGSSPTSAPFGAAAVPLSALPPLLDRAGISTPDGTVTTAWTWQDAGGRNLLLAWTKPQGPDSTAPQTVTVGYAVVQDLDGQPEVVRGSDDGPSCPQGLPASGQVSPGSVTLTDTDGNGHAEVTVGWTHRCGAESDSSVVSLVAVSQGNVLRMQADGVLGGSLTLIPAPDPPGEQWPAGLLTSTAALFARLYH